MAGDPPAAGKRRARRDSAVTTTWTVICKDCDAKVVYSDAARQAAIERGQSPPERCAACRRTHRRQTSRLGLAYVDLEPGRAVPARGLKAGRLGRIVRDARPHSADDVEPDPIDDDEFGIKDEHVAELISGLAKHQVAIVQAGTGSGKSTFLPYRLLVPPAPFERDHLTRHGQIVVTQPRIDASTGIPNYVAERLHGSEAGPGLDIGYRNSKATDKSDASNKLVYLTDGTLVNMIRKGELHTISTVVIDEAHERSLNIDLILALLRREMRNYPHLRLLIVSATLEENTFASYFAPEYDVLSCPMPSKVIHPVHERWRVTEVIPRMSWPRRMPDEVARTAIEVLRWMELGEAPPDIPDGVPGYQGDVLCFLPGKGPIGRAITTIQELLGADDDLRDLVGKVELLPLYSELPTAQRRRALNPKTRRSHTKYRIIVSTNLAETSLTIDGIRHVIDSGLNNLKTWDPRTAASEMEPKPHSRSGLLQRRGRAGRNAPGVWHCLFTEDQFHALDYETAPEIARAPLSAVILNAAASGVSDPASLRWLPPGPSSAELTRVRAELLALGAITEHGDPTTFGREINAGRGEFSDTTLLINADLAGCVVEAATVLAVKSKTLETGALLRWSSTWPAEAKLHVDDVHATLLDGCPDDIEMVCRIVSYWERQSDVSAQRAWCDRHYIDRAALRTLLDERTKLLTGLQSKMTTEEIRPIQLALLPRLRAVIAWSHANGIYRTDVEDGTLALTPVRTARSDADLIAAMSQGTTPVIDPRSWTHRKVPDHLVLLGRSRDAQWSSPLDPPQTIQQGALCAAVDPAVLDGATSLHTLLARIGLGDVPSSPAYLPGDRFRAWVDGSTAQAIEALDGIPDPTIELAGDDDAWDAVDGHTEETGGLGGEIRTLDDDEGDRYVSPYEEDPDRSDHDPDPMRRTAPAAHHLPGLALLDTHEVTDPQEAVVQVLGVQAGMLLGAIEDGVDEFDRFADQHPAGTEIAAIIEEVRRFPRDRRPLIVARDRASRCQLILDGALLGTGLRFTQTGQLARGTVLTLNVDGYDRRRRVRYLSQTGATIAALTGLRSRTSASQRSIVVNAALVDADEQKLWVHITPDELSRLGSEHPPIVLGVESARLHVMPGLQVGTMARVKLSWGQRKSRYERVPGLGGHGHLPDGPWEVHDDTVVLTDLPTVADWQRLVAYASDALGDSPELAARLRTAVMWGARKLLSPYVEVIDHGAIAKMQRDGTAPATVIAADGRNVSVRLPHGGVQRIPTRALTWGNQRTPEYQVGDSVTAYITTADPSSGEVRAELRDPTTSPYLALTVGQRFAAEITERNPRDERDFIARLTSLGIDARLRGSDARNADVGDTIEVRITGIDTERHRVDVSGWLYDEVLTLPARFAELWSGPPGGPPRRYALERIVPDDVALWVAVAADGGLDVRVRSANDDSGERAIARLDALAHGGLAYISIPDKGVVLANDSALLRQLAPNVAAATTRRRSGDRDVTALVVAANDDDAFIAALAVIQSAYPKQWVSDGFKYERVKMEEAARPALRNSGIAVRLNIESGSPPRAIFSGEPAEIPRAAELLRQHGIPVPTTGGWRPDKRIAFLA